MKKLILLILLCSSQITFGQDLKGEYDQVVHQVLTDVLAQNFENLESFIPSVSDIQTMMNGDLITNKRQRNQVNTNIENYQNDIRAKILNNVLTVSTQLKARGFDISHIAEINHKFSKEGTSTVAEVVCKNGDTEYSIYIKPLFKWNEGYRLWDSIVVKD